jgi:hypothetical protein
VFGDLIADWYGVFSMLEWLVDRHSAIQNAAGKLQSFEHRLAFAAGRVSLIRG